MTKDKHSLRQHFQALRNNLPPHQRREAELKMSLRVTRHPWFKQAHHIAFYWPCNNEIGLQFILAHALNQNKCCYLPRTLSQEQMAFHRFTKGQRLITGRYQIKEPHRATPTRAIQKMDLILLPLVAFDRSGYRLGMGAGYYDRALQQCRSYPLRLGVGFAIQQADQLPHDDWDVPLHGIATEAEFIQPSGAIRR